MTVPKDEFYELKIANERLQGELAVERTKNAQHEKWIRYLESSVDDVLNSVVAGLESWREALHRMSTLNGGDGETLIEPE